MVPSIWNFTYSGEAKELHHWNGQSRDFGICGKNLFARRKKDLKRKVDPNGGIIQWKQEEPVQKEGKEHNHNFAGGTGLAGKISSCAQRFGKRNKNAVELAQNRNLPLIKVSINKGGRRGRLFRIRQKALKKMMVEG